MLSSFTIFIVRGEIKLLLNQPLSHYNDKLSLFLAYVTYDRIFLRYCDRIYEGNIDRSEAGLGPLNAYLRISASHCSFLRCSQRKKVHLGLNF